MEQIITASIAALVGGGAFWGAVKGGLINIRIGTNGEKKEDKVTILETQLTQLTETANHNFTHLKERFEEHTKDDKDFFKEQREFNRDLWKELTDKK